MILPQGGKSKENVKEKEAIGVPRDRFQEDRRKNIFST
jgi:hypothetical protein